MKDKQHLDPLEKAARIVAEDWYYGPSHDSAEKDLLEITEKLIRFAKSYGRKVATKVRADTLLDAAEQFPFSHDVYDSPAIRSIILSLGSKGKSSKPKATKGRGKKP